MSGEMGLWMLETRARGEAPRWRRANSSVGPSGWPVDEVDVPAVVRLDARIDFDACQHVHALRRRWKDRGVARGAQRRTVAATAV